MSMGVDAMKEAIAGSSPSNILLRAARELFRSDRHTEDCIEAAVLPSGCKCGTRVLVDALYDLSRIADGKDANMLPDVWGGGRPDDAEDVEIDTVAEPTPKKSWRTEARIVRRDGEEST